MLSSCIIWNALFCACLFVWVPSKWASVSHRILYMIYYQPYPVFHRLKSKTFLRLGLQNPTDRGFEERQIHASNSGCLTSVCRKHQRIDCETDWPDTDCPLEPPLLCCWEWWPVVSDLLPFGSASCRAAPSANLNMPSVVLRSVNRAKSSIKLISPFDFLL